jgi:triacylglycerol lipase
VLRFPGTRRTHAMVGSVALAAATMVGSFTGATPASADQAPRDPVLFVHGFTRSSADFAAFKQSFVDAGYKPEQLFTIDYNSFAPNAYTATLIQARVDQILAETGKKQVDIVAHSMGAYGTRYFLAHLGGQAKVDAFVSIAGPNHGTLAAYSPDCQAIPSCAEMVPGSAFLNSVNLPDETPNAAKTRYFTIWTAGDDLVYPATSVALDGAVNWMHPNTSLTHMQVAVDPLAIDQARIFIRNS